VKNFKAFVIPHFLSYLRGLQAIAVSLKEKLHPAEVGQDDHAFKGVIGRSYMQTGISISPTCLKILRH
jgi:hypothetical protein